MPFKPIGNGKYRSPSGRTFTKKQVKMYYATNGFKKRKINFQEVASTIKRGVVKAENVGKAFIRNMRGGDANLFRQSWGIPKTMKKKPKLIVNNKLKGALGESDFTKDNKPTGKIQINVKAHEGDKAELASTIKHELMHIAKPKATEKEVYKATRKTKIPPSEQNQLISKLKSINYKSGALKRKFKMGRAETKPGDFINKFNEGKAKRKINNQTSSKSRTAIMGM